MLGAELQEALEARGRVLRSLALVAVRQEQRQAAESAPFGFAGADELVDHDLGAVGEIAELAFPDHQRLRLGAGVAVLEAQDGLLGQQGVDDPERVGPVGERAERHVLAIVDLAVQDGMAMEERAATAVLADDSDVMPFGEQGRVGHGLGKPPVHVGVAAGHFRTAFHDALYAAVQPDVRRDARNRLTEFGDAFRTDRRVDLDIPFGIQVG